MYENMLFGQEQTSDNKVLIQLEEKLNAYIQELPVLGFNSGKYDLNATTKFLFPYSSRKHHPIKFTVKRNNNHMYLKTNSLKFLDISNYLPPEISYDQFLKACECEQTKGYFPYQWLDCFDKLEETSLPPHAAYYSIHPGRTLISLAKSTTIANKCGKTMRWSLLKISWFATIIWM